MKADIVEVVTAITTTAPNNDEMLQVHLSTGSGFSVPSIWKSTTSSCSRRNSSSTFATDVNNDGCADFVCVTGRGEEVCWMVALSDCIGTFGELVSWKCGGMHPPQLPADALASPLHLHKYRSPSRPLSLQPPPQKYTYLMADINNDGKADALYFDAATNAGTWYVAASDGNSSFASTWSVWMYGHGRSFVHSKGIGTSVATHFFIGMPFARNFSDSPAPVAVWPEGQWKVVPTCSVNGCYATPCEYNTWEAWDMRYVPRINGTYRWFDTADEDAIDDTIDSLQAALVDYVLIDLTNAIQVPFILKRTRAFLLRLAERRANKTATLQFAFALGWYWSSDPGTFEEQAQLAWDWFYSNQTYGAPYASAKDAVDFKPLLVQYGTPAGKAAWLNYTGNKTYANKFSLKWSYGSTPTDGPGGECPVGRPPPSTHWLPPQEDWGLFYGWGYPNGSLPNPQTMVVQPGWNNSLGCVVERDDGAHFARDWERVLAANPREVVVATWNDFGEDTCVQPSDTSRLKADGEEGWAAPDLYWNMTVHGLRTWKSMP